MRSANRHTTSRLAELILYLCLLVIAPSAVYAEGNTTLKGRVTDVAGLPVAGAMVFLYSSPDVRRSADFISAPTAKDGQYLIVVVPGRYWAVARLKKIEGFGPLMPGDRHSGDPREVEIAQGQEVDMPFVVFGLKDALTSRKREGEAPARIGGRIIDEKGDPVTGAYAIAQKNGTVAGIPDYVSAWVDANGRYMLMLPKGEYFIGSAREFPPREDLLIFRQFKVETDRSDMDIVRMSKP
jgi:hypothetical protein